MVRKYNPAPKGWSHATFEHREITRVQVLFKRKPVAYVPRPTIEDDRSEVQGVPIVLLWWAQGAD